MFYEIAGQGPPTQYEISRLRSFEVTGRLNNFLLQFFDTGTDIAFMLVLFDQSGAITLPGFWNLYKSTVGDNCPGAPAFFGTDRDKVYALATACAVVLAVSMSYRLFMSLRQIIIGRRDLEDWSDWLHVFTGLFISLIDPWNGSLFINEAMLTQRLEKTDYDLAVSELRSDIFLVLLEDLPQLIIQIIYGVFAGQLQRTTVAWFLAVFSSSMNIASQTHEIITLALHLPKLKRIHDKQAKNGN